MADTEGYRPTKETRVLGFKTQNFPTGDPKEKQQNGGEDDDVDMNEVVSEGYRVDEVACMLGLGTQNR